MPKYSEYLVAGYYLYFTSHCIVEAIHAHASDKKLTEEGSAKFWITESGDAKLDKQGMLSDREVLKIQKYIKKNFVSICNTWKDFKGLKNVEDIEFRNKLK